jgi:hypothetical protein
MLAAIGFFVVAMVVFMVVLLTGENTAETVIKEKIIEKTKIVYKDRLVVKKIHDRADDKKVAENSRNSNIAKDKKRWNKSVKVKKLSDAEERKRRLLAQMNADVPANKLSLIGGGSKGGSSSKSYKGQSSLSQKQMSRVVSKNKGRLQICYEQALKKGAAPADKDLKANFNVVVGGSGVVKKCTLTGSAAKYGFLTNCLSRAVKKWMFPAASGESHVVFPILFTPSG